MKEKALPPKKKKNWISLEIYSIALQECSSETFRSIAHRHCKTDYDTKRKKN